MKRLFAILMMICLLLTLFCGCKSNDDADLNQVTGGAGGNVSVNKPGDLGGDAEDVGNEDGEEEQPQSPEETPDEQPGTQTPQTPEEQPEEQPEETPEEENQQPVDYTTADWITVGSYNVKSLYYDETTDAGSKTPMSKFNAVCDELRKIDADIVGLQELDRFSTRSGKEVDQLAELAKKLGYSHYYFTKTIDANGGEYGHGILSKYPLATKNSYYFADFPGNIDDTQPRGFSRCELKVGNKVLVFYNTHLARMTDLQMLTITNMMEEDVSKGKYAVLTGDMNANPSVLNSSVELSGCVLLNTVESPQNTTYQAGLKGEINPIDNIVVTENLEYYWDAAKKSGIMVNPSAASDHYPIYTYIRIKK